MFENCKNTNKKGDLGLGVAIAYFSIKGFSVSIPLTDSQDYDLVVEIEDTLCKVQVKATAQRAENGNFKVPLRVRCGNPKYKFNNKLANETFYDYLFVLTEDRDYYFIPKKNILKNNEITLGKKYQKYRVNLF